MRLKDINEGQRVAVVFGNEVNWRTEFGTVQAVNVDKRVYSRQRFITGELKGGYVAVAIDPVGRQTESTRTELVKPNQIRDEQETRDILAKQQERKLTAEVAKNDQRAKAEAAVAYINSALGDNYARVSPTTPYGQTFPVTGYHVNLSATGADKLATLLNDNGLCP